MLAVRSLLLLAACAGLCLSQEEDSATSAVILASKNVLNRYLVEGKDLTVQYSLYNVGDSAAFSVILRDATFPPTDFEVVQGLLEAKWDRINPGSNVSHTVILKPLKGGYFNFTSADVTYLARENAEEVQIGYTSSPGEGGIASRRDFDRLFSAHLADWAVFALFTLPSLGLPLFLWHSSHKKYESKSKKQ